MKVCALFCLLPGAAWADWSPQPSYFTYETAFARCDEATEEAVRSCYGAISDAYTLRREIALALLPCIETGRGDCAGNLEAAGVPSQPLADLLIGGCSLSADALPDFTSDSSLRTVTQAHCIVQLAEVTETSDHPRPNITEISCGVIWIECGELTIINMDYWFDRASAAVNADVPKSSAALRLESALEACRDASSGGWAEDLERMECATRIYAEIALDLEGRLP